MSTRVLGVLLALALLGVAGGYAGQHVLDPEKAPESFTALPVPASSPSYPVNEYDVSPDPGVAPLPTDVALRRMTLREGGERISVAAPGSWRRVAVEPGAAWNFSRADYPVNTYLLRVTLLGGQRISTSVAATARLAALRAAERDGNMEAVTVETQAEDGFVATYLQDGYRRVLMERYSTLGDSTAQLAVAVTGREVDRTGMADLLERVLASARR
ncbi:hypothetical protein GHK92_16730 [Nocardioides sp. dk4132]|uniref:hypothetical protein n=1 Tax=unclassified Nocardioides TaxID=2615069 RepID=UPI0012959AD4|nr:MULTISPECIES: hypothetical protein [unclassified Nocardioides]MQW77520.1 hypothetical protein [Nocardioides sp. dk4132]QGA09317.1 hypothetical protein GFH29_19410 [Nocardioides sp. dk884]